MVYGPIVLWFYGGSVFYIVLTSLVLYSMAIFYFESILFYCSIERRFCDFKVLWLLSSVVLWFYGSNVWFLCFMFYGSLFIVICSIALWFYVLWFEVLLSKKFIISLKRMEVPLKLSFKNDKKK